MQILYKLCEFHVTTNGCRSRYIKIENHKKFITLVTTVSLVGCLDKTAINMCAVRQLSTHSTAHSLLLDQWIVESFVSESPFDWFLIRPRECMAKPKVTLQRVAELLITLDENETKVAGSRNGFYEGFSVLIFAWLNVNRLHPMMTT
jgi:hypothetical protein